MPRGYRRVVLAFVGWLILGNAPHGPAKPADTQKNQAQTHQMAVTPPPKQPVPPKPYRPACDQPHDSAEASLCASIGQVTAAKAANEIAGIALYVNIVGVVLILLTLLATAWAARSAARAAVVAEGATRDADAALAIAERNAAAAAKSADVAANGLELTRQAHIRDARPWITFKSYDTAESQNTTINGVVYENAMSFMLNFRNTGKSPAVKAVMQWEPKMVGILDGIPPITFDDTLENVEKLVIGPELNIITPPLGFGGKQLQLFLERKTKVIIYTEIRYSGLFEQEENWLTRHCMSFVYDGQSIRNGERFPRFASRTVGPFNDMS